MDELKRPVRFWSPVLILTAAGAGILFFGWCTVDLLLVRSPRYPENIHEYDNWQVSAAAVVLVFIADFLLAARLQAGSRVGVALLATALAIPLGIVLVLFLGVAFHLSIGGRL